AREAERVRPRLGVVFQNPGLDPKLTVAENLVHHGHLYGLGGAALRGRVTEVLRALDLSERADDLVETLSGGLARRTELGRGLLHSPELLLLDEPVVDGTLRVERSRGHELVRDVVEAFPGEVRSVTFGRPTLEDVFVHLTGRRFWEANGRPAA